MPVTANLMILLTALLELMRLEKTAMAVLFTLLGAYIVALPGESWPARIFAGAAVVGMITAFGFVINDYYDMKEDTIGKPQRPIPSGRVSCRLARSFAWALAATAVLTSALLGVEMAVFAIAMVGISAAYSVRLKNTVILGNSAVAVLVSSVPIYGAIAVGRVTTAVFMASAITFPYVLAQEALFNLEDEECDRLAGLRTTATYLGADGTIQFIRTVLVTTMAIALAPWFIGWASATYLVGLMVCVHVPIVFMMLVLRKPISKPVVTSMVKLSRLLWVTSLIPFALLK